MKKTVNKSMFIDEFRSFEESSGRYTQMGGYDGLSALFDYLEDLEDVCNEEMELDVIALCSVFTQYDSFEDLQKEYDDIKSLEDLQDRTSVIEYGDGQLIIQQF